MSAADQIELHYHADRLRARLSPAEIDTLQERLIGHQAPAVVPTTIGQCRRCRQPYARLPTQKYCPACRIISRHS